MKKITRYGGLLWVCCMFLALPAKSQQKVTGKVIDAQSGKALIGATVRVQDTNRGTTTNKLGIFSLKLSAENTTLLISYVGYKQKILKVDTEKLDLFIALEPAEVELQQVVVESSVTPQKRLLKATESINIISASEIDRNNPVFLEQSLNQLPNVQMDVRSGTSQSHVVIRGIGNASRFNMRGIKTYFNGIPLTAADGTTTLDAIDFTTIGRVEVIKGPDASLYGANTGGVLNLYTQKPGYKNSSLSQSLTVGSYGLARTNTTLKAGGENSRFLVNYGYQDYGGYREHAQSTKNFVTLTGEVQASSRQQVSMLVLYTARDDNFAGELNGVDFRNNPRKASGNYIAKDIGNTSRQFLAGITHTYNFSSGFVNKSSIYAENVFQEQPIEPFFRRLQDTRLGSRSVFTYATGPVDITFGGEYTRNFIVDRHFQISTGGQPGVINTDNELTLNQYSVFGQATFNITSQTIVTAGAGLSGGQYDVRDLFAGDNTDASGDRTFDLVFSPRIALSHQLSDNIAVYANASTGFTPPTVSEISVRDGSINTNVNAEKSYNLDIGSRGSIASQRLQYNVSLFILRLKDSFVPRQQNGFTFFVNAGELTNTGAELSLRYQWLIPRQNGGWSVSSFLTYGYNHARFNDFVVAGTDFSGNRVTGISPNQLALGLDLNAPFGGYAHTVYRLVDERPITDSNSVYADSYSLLNGKVGIKRRLGSYFNLDIHAGVNNALDTLYSPTLALNQRPGGPNGPRYFNPAAGVNFYGGLALSYEF